METTHPGNMIEREIAENISDIGHESILQPNPANLQEEEIYEGFKIIRISSPLDKYFYGLIQGIYQFLKNNFKEFIK